MLYAIMKVFPEKIKEFEDSKVMNNVILKFINDHNDRIINDYM